MNASPRRTSAVLSGRLLLCTTLLGLSLSAAEPSTPAPSPALLRSAIEKSLPLLTQGARGSMKERERCFTCHNQGLPIMALATVQSRGVDINAAELRKQTEFTAAFLERNRTNYLAGRGQGGQADTAGYALWALENGGWKPDATTAAVVEYLLQWQDAATHWTPQSRRPPTEQSLFTSTHAALRALATFGTPEQKPRIEKRMERVQAWLLKTAPQDHEDRVFRLRALHVAGAPAAEILKATTAILDTQQGDGGFAQLPTKASDAYATATALVALHQTGGLSTDARAYQRGLGYLLNTQLADGSWRVVSRSKPIQTYYESGYPHGTNQFISITAAGWATTALALALPKAHEKVKPSRVDRLIFPPEHWHNHGSCLVEAPNGHLIACWFHGSGEREADDVKIEGARLRRDAKEWSGRFTMTDTPDYPDTNCCMFIDPHERLWLLWPTLLANQWESAPASRRYMPPRGADGRPQAKTIKHAHFNLEWLMAGEAMEHVGGR